MTTKRVKLPTAQPGLWRHFKGGRYEVLGSAVHSETGEELVLYRPLGDAHAARLWARPAKMFLEKVRVNGRSVPRFEKLKAHFPTAPTARAALLDRLMKDAADPSRVAWPRRLDLIVFDFDGVMTDNTVRVRGDAGESVVCSRGDGMGLDRLRKAGARMIVLSKEKHPVVSARCAKLKLECHQGVEGKLSYLKAYLKKNRLDRRRVIYLGNDINDLECLRYVGLPAVVADAHPSVLGAAKLVLRHPGGRGAVRELADLVIERFASKRTGRLS